MIITPIRTSAVTAGALALEDLVAASIASLGERSVLAVTSKVVSLCEGAVVPVGELDKHELIRQEAELYLPPEESAYGITLTVRDQILIPTAGIDESNGNGYYILWPRQPQRTANRLRAFLREHYGVREAGVIITDSKTTPLRRGTTGIALAHSGFAALHNYVGTPDIFGKPLRVTQANVADGLAAAAVAVMGEGDERTPLAVIGDCGPAEFRDADPDPGELAALKIPLADDLYAPMLSRVDWRRGWQQQGRGL